jgi:prepilin-type processing-associated H-X9-DG protein
MYAQYNKGFVPVRYRSVVVVPGGGPAQIKTTSTFGPGAGFVAGNPATPNSANGPALLVKAGPMGNGANYLDNNDVMFCPSDIYRAPFRNPVSGWGPTDQTKDPGLLSNQSSMSYWWWYFPEKYWPASGVESTSSEVNQNHKASVKNAPQKMYITDQYIPDPPAGTAVTDIYKNFHKDGMNVGYLDGHVKWVQASAFDMYYRSNPTAAYSTIIINASNKEY